MNLKKRGLGKGLSALGVNELLSDLNNHSTSPSNNFRRLPIEILRPGKYQPRKDIRQESLQELATSIQSQGIIQPLVVRGSSQGQYEIIAGERRWRAAQIAGLSEVPVVIHDINDEAAMAVALIENIQREDLNAIDLAIGLQRLIDEFEMTHEEVADIVGKSRTTVTNLLRLLSLNEDVKQLLQNHEIEMGHARALLTVTGLKQSQTAKDVITKKLSVRETEKLIRKLLNPALTSKQKLNRDPDVLRLQADLSDKLAAAVTIQHSTKGKGKLIIQYNSVDELEGILDHIK